MPCTLWGLSEQMGGASWGLPPARAFLPLFCSPPTLAVLAQSTPEGHWFLQREGTRGTWPGPGPCCHPGLPSAGLALPRVPVVGVPPCGFCQAQQRARRLQRGRPLSWDATGTCWPTPSPTQSKPNPEENRINGTQISFPPHRRRGLLGGGDTVCGGGAWCSGHEISWTTLPEALLSTVSRCLRRDKDQGHPQGTEPPLPGTEAPWWAGQRGGLPLQPPPGFGRFPSPPFPVLSTGRRARKPPQSPSRGWTLKDCEEVALGHLLRRETQPVQCCHLSGAWPGTCLHCTATKGCGGPSAAHFAEQALGAPGNKLR